MYNNPFLNQQYGINQYPQYNNGQQIQQQNLQQIQQINTLQGKMVDSVEVVKGMDIPLNGSTSYFPLVDGSAIVSKKLQTDGTSKIIVYKQIEENEKQKVEYLTKNDLNDYLKDFSNEDIEDIKEELKDLKKTIKSMKKEK